MKETIEAYGLGAVGAITGAWKYNKPQLSARNAWLAMGIGIAFYEWKAPEGELLSEGYDRLIEKHPLLGRLPALVIAHHLINTFPDNRDPVSIGLRLIKRRG